MKKGMSGSILLCLSFFFLSQAQDQPQSSVGGFNIGFHNYGISFGNSSIHRGLRFNWSDDSIEEINGLNFTLWRPGEELSGNVHGLAIGIVSPAADNIGGIAVGGLAVISKSSVSGKPYQVQCGAQEQISSAAWMTAQLRNARAMQREALPRTN